MELESLLSPKVPQHHRQSQVHKVQKWRPLERSPQRPPRRFSRFKSNTSNSSLRHHRHYKCIIKSSTTHRQRTKEHANQSKNNCMLMRLIKHLFSSRNDKPFTCNICGGKFSRYSSLWSHKKLHSGEKNYKCDQCSSSFAKAVYLKNHMRIHSGEVRSRLWIQQLLINSWLSFPETISLQHLWNDIQSVAAS